MMIARLLTGLCTVSCGGDDDKEFSTNNIDISTNTESTAFLATEQVKTITLKPISNQDVYGNNVNSEEYLVYKDYYYKYTLCLSDARIYVKPYTNYGTGWTHYYGGDYVGTWRNISGVYDVGDVTDITKIEKRDLYYDICLRYSKDKYDRYGQFKPGHGYGIGFLSGADKEIRQMRVFPTKYTLDNNDVLTSVTSVS